MALGNFEQIFMGVLNHVGHVGLMRHSCWSNSWVILVGETRGSFSWVKPVGHSRGSNLWVILVGQTRGAFSWVTLVGHSCGSNPWVILVGCCPPNIRFATEQKLSTFEFCTDDIVKIIKLLDPNKVPGHDGISIPMIKLCASSIAKPLSVLFRNCFKNQCFPEKWKKANIVPVHKKMINN